VTTLVLEEMLGALVTKGVARGDGWRGGWRVEEGDINSHNILRGGI